MTVESWILTFFAIFHYLSDCRKKYEQNEAKRQAQIAKSRKQAAFAKGAI